MIVDMESFDAVAEAHARGVRAAVLRAVSDASHEELPVFLDRSRGGDGDLDVRRVLTGAIMHPGAIPILIRLRRRVRACAVALSRVAAELVCSLDLEPSDLADHGPAAAAEAARLDAPLAGDRSET